VLPLVPSQLSVTIKRAPPDAAFTARVTLKYRDEAHLEVAPVRYFLEGTRRRMPLNSINEGSQ
jgi:hypothetical protein